MKFVYEATAKSVDEAIDIACAEAGVGLTEAEIEVLELGSKGFFGIGQKEAKVRLIVERPDSEAKKRPQVTKIAAPMPEPEAAPRQGKRRPGKANARLPSAAKAAVATRSAAAKRAKPKRQNPRRPSANRVPSSLATRKRPRPLQSGASPFCNPSLPSCRLRRPIPLPCGRM